MKSINTTKQDPKYYKDFPITSVCRSDLESIGFDIKNVDDSAMSKLASKMAVAYCNQVFWWDLEIIAEYLKIKKHEKRQK